MSYAKEVVRYHVQAAAVGVAYEDAETLRRAAMVLHRWAEHECNGVIQRAEAGQTDHRGRHMIEGRTYAVSNINGPGPLRYYPTADRETPALWRAKALAESYGACLEHQCDPRGWPLTLRFAVDGRIAELCPPCR